MGKLLVLACLAVTLIASIFTAGAVGAGEHFTKNGFPACTDIGTQLQCTAELAGLGGETLVATVQASGTATGLTCTSPGGNQAPGQNPAVPVSAGGSQTIENPKNGRASVSPSTATPTITPKQAGCPNNNWVVTIQDVTFTSYTLTITQGGQLLFSCAGSFQSPSQNGQSSTPSCS